MGVLQLLARLFTMGVFHKVARLIALGVFNNVARLLIVGVLSLIARLAFMGVFTIVARFNTPTHTLCSRIVLTQPPFPGTCARRNIVCSLTGATARPFSPIYGRGWKSVF